MQSTSFRLISTIITLLLLLALLGVIGLAVRTTPAMTLGQVLGATPVTSTPRSRPTATSPDARATRTPPLAQEIALGPVAQVADGGFSFRPLPDYTLTFSDDSATLTAGSTSAPGQDALFSLRGGPVTRFITTSLPSPELPTILEAYAASYAQAHPVRVGAPQELAVDGVPALAADLVADEPDQGVVGRITLAQPEPGWLFVMVGTGPADRWQAELRQQYDALLASVRFLPLQATPTPTLGIVLAPTPTLPATATPQPSPTGTAAPLAPATPDTHWQIWSDGNVINDLALAGNTLWAATEGGFVAWNRASARAVKFTTRDGLAVNYATTVVNCPLPNLGVVFGHDHGLQLFDLQQGRWKTLDSNTSAMRSDRVVGLYCDLEGGLLWVVYADQGIDVFDAAANTWSAVPLPAQAQEAGALRDVVTVDEGQRYWLLAERGVIAVDGQTATLYNGQNSPLDTDQVTAMAVDGSGSVWLTTASTLYRFDGESWSSFGPEQLVVSGAPAGRLTDLAIAADGTMWLAWDQAEVCRFDPGTGRCLAFYRGESGMAAPPLTALEAGAGGQVYYATAGDGVSWFDGEGWHHWVSQAEPLLGNQVRAMTQQTDGTIWIATDLGVQSLNPDGSQTLQTFTRRDGTLPFDNIQVVHAADGGIWIGGQGRVSFYDGIAWADYGVNDGLLDGQVRAIAVDASQRVWFGTSAGLSILTGEAFFNLTRADNLPSDQITALATAGQVVWIGSQGGGLYRFQDNQLQVFNTANVQLPSDNITALALHQDGSLLIGTDRGLARFHEGRFSPIPDVSDTTVTALASTPRGEIWVGTADRGAFYFDGATWSPFPRDGRLPAPQVSALLVDQNGVVWIGSRRGGLLRYTP
ncbi:MAG: hypothetical protein KatS3mg050_2888 [Litorilinea sp.]|nr:MAG: hypothetical protein KatS3mg050_2888 [Litorilinea sp.]